MTIQCRDILALPSLRKANIVAGRSGLHRILRWVHVLDIPDVKSWAESGDLLLLSGLGLNNDSKEFIRLIRDMDEKEIAGLIVAIGPYISQIPPDVIELGDVLNFPIFALPWEIRFVDVTRDVGNYIVKRELEERSVSHLLEGILFGQGSDYEYFAQRAAYCGYDLSTPHQIMVLHAAAAKEASDNAKQAEKDAFSDIEQCIRQVLGRHNKQGPLVVRGSTIIMLIPVACEGRSAFLEIKEMSSEMIRVVTQKYPGFSVFAGIGSCCASLSEIRISFEHAAYALEYVQLSDDGEHVRAYGQMGIYRLLTSFRNRDILTSFCRDLVEPLRQYDNVHGTDLTNNIVIYLEENGNVVQAAKRLFLHRNTLLYRLQKVQEITGLNLENTHDRLSLHIALLTDILFRKSVQK